LAFSPYEDYSAASPNQDTAVNDTPLQTPQQLSSHIRSLRRRLELTQAQLGARLGVEQARIGKIERNPGSISVEQLIQLLSVLEAEILIRPRNAQSRAAAEPKAAW
jgi:HTH-type transcriptional regulator/antitoxin HipB